MEKQETHIAPLTLLGVGRVQERWTENPPLRFGCDFECGVLALLPACKLLSSRIPDISSTVKAWKLDSWEMAKRHRQGEESKAHSSFLWDSMMHGKNCKFSMSQVVYDHSWKL